MNDTDATRDLAAATRAGQRSLAAAGAERRSSVLSTLAGLLAQRRAALLDANRIDLELARESGLAAALVSRLELSDRKLDGLIDGVQTLAAGEDPVGRTLERTEIDNGLMLRKVSSPIGVLLVIFESRPDAAIQIGSLAIRSANGAILKGGKEALHSNRALLSCLRDALEAHAIEAAAIQPVETREAVAQLLRYENLIDLVIPRGSNQLVRQIQESTRIPVLGHADGICHLYVDSAADLAMATRIAIDSKCNYPAACNAIETMLVHRDFLPQLPALCDELSANGVELRGDEAIRAVCSQAAAASDQDWGTEHGALILNLRAVAGIDEAIAHIHRFGSAHTDAIVSADPERRQYFLDHVDSASVFANASTRFADGYRYGLGAEVGISTSRLHARGPVGVEGLATTRWLLEGNGQTVAEYGPGRRQYTHRRLPVTPH